MRSGAISHLGAVTGEINRLTREKANWRRQALATVMMVVPEMQVRDSRLDFVGLK